MHIAPLLGRFNWGRDELKNPTSMQTNNILEQ